jgi:hypothetical protein
MHATKLPMPADDVVKCVHTLARRQKANPGLVFLDHNQVLDVAQGNDANDNDSDYVSREDEEYSISDADDDEPDDYTDYDSSVCKHKCFLYRNTSL